MREQQPENTGDKAIPAWIDTIELRVEIRGRTVVSRIPVDRINPVAAYLMAIDRVAEHVKEEIRRNYVVS